jgi:hypothetical protein
MEDLDMKGLPDFWGNFTNNPSSTVMSEPWKIGKFVALFVFLLLLLKKVRHQAKIQYPTSL